MAVGEAEPELPPLSQLGEDLLDMTPLWRVAALASPFACTLLFFVLASRGLWWLALPCLAAHTFLTYASVSHDLVHGTLGLSPRANDVLLALVELLGLRSGHAYRASHLFHHRRFPDPEDLEGAPARMTWFRALLEGPVYPWRLGLRALRRGGARERWWIGIELGTILACSAVAVYLWVADVTPIPAIYGGLLVLGSWLFPFVFVYLMHDATGKSAFFQTRAFRGRIVPALMLHHTYHLEHHLYPMVPARNWRALGRRLDPFLEKAGVVPVRLP